MFEPAGAVVADRPEEGAIVVAAVPDRLEVVVDQVVGAGMQRQVPDLFALAADPQVRDAAPRVLEVLDRELAQLVAAQRVEEQGREDRAVALLLDRFFVGRGVLAGRHEQVARLVVAERRRLAFVALDPGALDALDRVVGDGVLVAEILEQRRQRGETVPDGRAARIRRRSAREVVAPGDDVGAGHDAELLRARDAGEPHEVADRVLVGAPVFGLRILREPLDLGRHVGQPPELGGI